MHTLDSEWLRTYHAVKDFGHEVSPRGLRVKELLHHAVRVSMFYPVLTVPERRLGYRFMAAEALWIVTGRDQLSDLTPYSKRMEEFSDDGETLTGAYGPRILEQLGYVVDRLVEDRDTRQATLTIWRPNPSRSKDIPCTVAMDFKIRNGQLHTQVFMRSSDVWLGLPYDVFSFTCVSYLVVATLRQTAYPDLEPGTLYLTAASSHVYQPALFADVPQDPSAVAKRAPATLWASPSSLTGYLLRLRDTYRGDALRWWE